MSGPFPIEIPSQSGRSRRELGDATRQCNPRKEKRLPRATFNGLVNV
jgi:hypothetical protein